MSEEEKDSIEILKNTDLDMNTIYGVDLHTYNYAVKTALNLIEKKDKEIEDLERRKEGQYKRFKRYKKKMEQTHEEIYEMQQQELEKKDKIIKDAIHYITTHYDFDGDTKAPYPTETEYNVLEILKGK